MREIDIPGIAALLGVTPQHVRYRMLKRPDAPQPIPKPTRKKWFRWSDVARWVGKK